MDFTNVPRTSFLFPFSLSPCRQLLFRLSGGQASAFPAAKLSLSLSTKSGVCGKNTGGVMNRAAFM